MYVSSAHRGLHKELILKIIMNEGIVPIIMGSVFQWTIMCHIDATVVEVENKNIDRRNN